MIIWLERMKRCFDSADSDYILYLEDDVFVKRKLEIKTCLPNQSSLAGILNPNSIGMNAVTYLSNKYNISYPHNNGGACGGSLYKKDTFLKIYDEIVRITKEDFEEIRNRWIWAGCLDVYMPLMYMTIGYNYETNGELFEPTRHPQWRNCDWGLLHFGGPEFDNDNNLNSILDELEKLNNGSR
jgi:hypothetical protein